jgi:hypothetical protein
MARTRAHHSNRARAHHARTALLPHFPPISHPRLIEALFVSIQFFFKEDCFARKKVMQEFLS